MKSILGMFISYGGGVTQWGVKEGYNHNTKGLLEVFSAKEIVPVIERLLPQFESNDFYRIPITNMLTELKSMIK